MGLIKKIIFSLVIALVIILSASFVIRVFIFPPVDATIDKDIKPETVTEVIQINILNSTKISGKANEVKKYMRSRGFDVVETGNYTEEVEKSFVIDRLGDKQSAIKVASAVGIPDSLIITEIDSSLFLRCSVILGKDLHQLNPFK